MKIDNVDWRSDVQLMWKMGIDARKCGQRGESQGIIILMELIKHCGLSAYISSRMKQKRVRRWAGWVVVAGSTGTLESIIL